MDIMDTVDALDALDALDAAELALLDACDEADDEAQLWLASADDASTRAERVAAVARIQAAAAARAMAELADSDAELHAAILQIQAETCDVPDPATRRVTRAMSVAADRARAIWCIESIVCTADGRPRGAQTNTAGSRAAARKVREEAREARAARSAQLASMRKSLNCKV